MNEESDDMATQAPTKEELKKLEILKKAKEKYKDKNKVNAVFEVGGKLNTHHKFDAVELSNDLRGKS